MKPLERSIILLALNSPRTDSTRGHPGIGFPVVVNQMPSRGLIQPDKAITISLLTVRRHE